MQDVELHRGMTLAQAVETYKNMWELEKMVNPARYSLQILNGAIDALEKLSVSLNWKHEWRMQECRLEDAKEFYYKEFITGSMLALGMFRVWVSPFIDLGR